MLTLLPLLTVAVPVVLELSVPAQVAPGQEVPVVVRAKNVSSLPITLVRAYPPNVMLGLKWNTQLLHEGKPLLRDERSHWIAQWAGGHTISAKQFLVLQPGESAEIHREKFSNYLPEGKQYGNKAEAEKAPKAALPLGEYTFRAHFGFARKFKEDGGALTPRFAPDARGRYTRAWTGTLDAEAKFTVAG